MYGRMDGAARQISVPDKINSVQKTQPLNRKEG